METILFMIFMIIFVATLLIWIGWNKELKEMELEAGGYVSNTKKIKEPREPRERKERKIKERPVKEKKEKKEKTNPFKKGKKQVEEPIWENDTEPGWEQVELKERKKKNEEDFSDFDAFGLFEDKETIHKEKEKFDFEEVDFEEEVKTIKPTNKGMFDDLFSEEELKELEKVEKTEKKAENKKPETDRKPVERKTEKSVEKLEDDYEFDFDLDDVVIGEAEEEKQEDFLANFDFEAKERGSIEEDFFEKKRESQKKNEKKYSMELDMFDLGDAKPEKSDASIEDFFGEEPKSEKIEKDEFDFDFDFDLEDEEKKTETPKVVQPQKKEVKEEKKTDMDDDDEILKMIDELFEITKKDSE